MTNSRLNLKQNRIRKFFSSFELGEHETTEKKREELEKDLTEECLKYIQMRLPVENITPEFEKEIKERVEKNILNAKIRLAKEEDLPNVMNLYNRSWMTSSTPFSPIDLNSLKEIYSFPETEILIAKVYGNDAGFVILDYEGPNKEIGVIAGLGVIPRFQRKGLGTVLGVAAWNHFKSHKVKELRAEVYVDNKVSYNFIKSLGFETYDEKTYKSEDFQLRNN
jgi:ribosomal protein S18 acetylase RimI-like enzyme